MFTVISKETSIQIIGGQLHPVDCSNPIDLMEPECDGGRMKDRANSRFKTR